MLDEIQARSPHGKHAYCVDNSAVLEILSAAIAEHKNLKSWIKSFSVIKYGRAAWIAFKINYRGTNQLEATEAKAEKLFQTLVYRRENSHYNMHLQEHFDVEKSKVEIRQTKKV
jgi:hypothetical protein